MIRITLLLLACIGFVAWLEEPPVMEDKNGISVCSTRHEV